MLHNHHRNVHHHRRQKIQSMKINYPTVITARVRSTREGNIYTWKCLSVHFWGGGGLDLDLLPDLCKSKLQLIMRLGQV